MKSFNALFLVCLISTVSFAQYETLETLVDPFTGGVRYGEPLITLHGPNGESYPISLSYGGNGVRVAEEASEVGLGWSLSSNEISRNVRGVADDYNNIEVDYFQKGEGSFSKEQYGPLYFRDFPYPPGASMFSVNDEMDFYTSEKRLGGDVFYGINYDNYYVKTSGLSGSLAMRLYDYSSLISSLYPYGQSNGETHDMFACKTTPFTASPVMFFKGDKGVNVKNSLLNNPLPKNGLFDDYTPEEVGANLTFDNLLPNGKVKTGKYVRYFTNSEIQDIKTNGQEKINNFIEADYYTNHSRSNNGDLIGAIQITTENGVTYHFSLPEYVYSSKNYTFNIDQNTGNPVDLESSSETVHSNGDPLYAGKWLLTAITGPHFEDNGAHGVIDAFDVGYYIQFKYGILQDRQTRKYPEYGLNYDMSTPRSKVNIFQHEVKDSESLEYKYTGSYSLITGQHFYPSTIETSTETLMYCWGKRNDDYSRGSTDKKIPGLRLDKLILVDNDNITTLKSENIPLNIAQMSSNYEQSLDESGIYSANFSTNIDDKVKQAVGLEYDYQLCPKFYKNSSSIVFTQVVTADNHDISMVSSVSTTGQSGKLTLKKIHRFIKGNIEYYDPVEFTYVTNNPDYDPMKEDNWGYYKNNQNGYYGNYTDETSKDYVDAWMLEKIHQPNGTRIELDYESNSYYTSYYNGREYSYADLNPDPDAEDPRIKQITPQRTFMIKSIEQVQVVSSTPQFERQIKFRVKLDADIPSNLRQSPLPSGTGLLSLLRFDGICTGTYYYDGTWNPNSPPGEQYEHYESYRYNTWPDLDIGYRWDDTRADIEPMVHTNSFYGRSNYANPEDPYGPIPSNLVSYTFIDANTIELTFKEPKAFAQIYELGANTSLQNPPGLAFECEACTPSTTPYDYGAAYQNNKFRYGYVSYIINSPDYGGGVRVKEAKLTNLDGGEEFKISTFYGLGKTTYEPDRFNFLGIGGEYLSSTGAYVLRADENLYYSTISTDPFIISPQVIYESPRIKYYGNGEHFQTKTTKYNVDDPFEIQAKPVERSDFFHGNPAAYLENPWTFLHVTTFKQVFDKTSLFGKPVWSGVVQKSDEGGLITSTQSTYTYSRVSSHSDMYYHRYSNNPNNTTGQHGYPYGYPEKVQNEATRVVEDIDVLTVENYALSKIEETNYLGETVITSFSEFDLLTGKYLKRKKTHSVLGELEDVEEVPGYKEYPALFVTKNEDLTSANITSPVSKMKNWISRSQQRTTFTDTKPVVSILYINNKFNVSDEVLSVPVSDLAQVNPKSVVDGFGYWNTNSKVCLLNNDKKVVQTLNPRSGVYSSSRYYWDHKLRQSEITNSTYFGHFFESFEDARYSSATDKLQFPTGFASPTAFWVDGSVSDPAHSGLKYLSISGESFITRKLNYDLIPGGSSYTDPVLADNRTYKVLLWVKSAHVNNTTVSIGLNGTKAGGASHISSTVASPVTDKVIASSGNWSLVQVLFEVPEGFKFNQSGQNFELRISNTGTGDIHIDDLMMLPVDSDIRAYVYNSDRDQVTHVFGSNGLYIRFEYDALGRVIKEYTEKPTGEELSTSRSYHHEKY